MNAVIKIKKSSGMKCPNAHAYVDSGLDTEKETRFWNFFLSCLMHVIAYPSRNFESKNRQKKKMHLKSVLNAFVFH